MENLNVYVSVLIGLGYIFYTIIGSFSLTPEDQYYNKLLQSKPFFINLVLVILFAVIGFWRVTYFDRRETFYFAPIIYLLLLRFFNLISILVNKRQIILATGSDTPPKGKKEINLLDRLFVFLLLVIPTVVCGIIMNKLNFGVFMK